MTQALLDLDLHVQEVEKHCVIEAVTHMPCGDLI